MGIALHADDYQAYQFAQKGLTLSVVATELFGYKPSTVEGILNGPSGDFMTISTRECQEYSPAFTVEVFQELSCSGHSGGNVLAFVARHINAQTPLDAIEFLQDAYRKRQPAAKPE